MKTKLILLAIFFIGFKSLSSAQDLTEKIKHIETTAQANDFIKANPKLKAEILTINSDNDSSSFAKKIFNAERENILILEGYSYKIIIAQKQFLMRESYIYFDGNKLPVKQIDSLRKIILSEYKAGTPFNVLGKKYTMDGNPNCCDLGWLQEDQLDKNFSSEVKKHKKGDIFTIDVPDKKWYYVTLKTDDDKELKTYTLLKVKQGK